MEPEVITERIEELLHNIPENNIQRLPEDIQEAIDRAIQEKAKEYAKFASKYSLESVIAGAIGQAFFAGYEYAVRYGNLNAEMEGINEAPASQHQDTTSPEQG